MRTVNDVGAELWRRFNAGIKSSADAAAKNFSSGDSGSRSTLLDIAAPMHPNQINTCVMQMINHGQGYFTQLGAPPLSVFDWRDRELARWNAAHPKEASRP